MGQNNVSYCYLPSSVFVLHLSSSQQFHPKINGHQLIRIVCLGSGLRSKARSKQWQHSSRLSKKTTHHSFVTLGVAPRFFLLLTLTPNSSASLGILRTLRVPRPQPLPPPLVRHFLGRFLKQSRRESAGGCLGQLSRSSGVVRTRPVDRAHSKLKTRQLADSSRLSPNTRDSSIQIGC